LGANIGTTCTALIASLVSMKFGAVQIALCHLFFNIIGIGIWFPVPIMRKLPLGAARLLGLYASYFRFVPILYLLIAFVGVPGICLLINATFQASVAGGVVFLLIMLIALGVFEFMWLVGIPIGRPLYLKVLSKEQREQGKRDLLQANNEIMGITDKDVEQPEAI